MSRRRFRKRADATVVAVQLRLETGGFTYEKWGGPQRCVANDWLVDNDGDVYTVGEQTFASTYRRVGPGRYQKVTEVWAERAEAHALDRAAARGDRRASPPGEED